MSVKDVLSSLRPAVPASGVTRVNVSRSHIWDAARRAFLRPTFNAQQPLYVKFMDDIGVAEEAIDQGGPRRELLQLLMDFLASKSPLFSGPEHAKHISAASQGCCVLSIGH